MDRLRPERHPGVWHSGGLLFVVVVVANPARGLLNREKKKKKKNVAASPRNHVTHPHIETLRKSALRRWSRSVSHPYKDSND